MKRITHWLKTDRLVVIAAACCLFFATSLAHAQRYLGAISGEVSDSTGAKVASAQVTAVEATTKYATQVTTSGDGVYSFPALNPGTYTVTVTAQGFRTEERTSIVLTAAQAQKIDFSLAPGAATESVQVTAETSLLDAGSANIATTLSTKEVTDLPNNGRNPFVMATLAPGVLNTGSGGYFQGKSSQFTNPFSGVAVQITTDGNSGGHNRLTLNGIPDDPAERLSQANYTGFVPSPEAVEEVKIQTSIFDAQVGHGNGTVTNTVVRTGTNNLHGAAYYVFQNTYLDANTWENAAKGASRPNNQVAQTGFVVDGPVYLPKLYDGRDKTYFMAAYEFYQTHTSVPYSAKVPTQAERGGDFSDLCTGGFNAAGQCLAGVQLYDPLSPVDASNNRTAFFPNNNISSKINPVGANFISYLPLPNVPGTNAQSSVNYISTQTSYRSTYPSFITRFDQAIGANNKLSVLFFRSGLTQAYPLQGFPKGIGPVTNGTGYGYTVYRNNRGGSIDDVHTFSSSLVLDSRFGLIYHPFGLTYPGNTNYDLSSLGITSSNLPYRSFPGYSATDTGASGATFSYASLAPGAGGQVSANTVGSLDEILTKLIGHHTLRFGFEGNLIRYNVQNPQSGLVGSSATQPGFAFDRRFTQKNSVNANVGSDASSGNPMASMMLGYFSQAYYSVNIAYALQQIYMAPFIQDDWRATKRLTLNLGFRWDYESPFTERFNRMVSNFCTTCASPLQAQVPSLTLNGGLQYVSASNRFPYSRDLNNFQPRLGFAYQASPTTVVRGGFGIIYFNTLETPISSGFSATTSYNNFTSSAPLNSLSNPYPSGVTLPTGSSLGLATQLGQSVSFVDPNHVQPKSTQYSASLQQQFLGNLALQIAYVGTRPTRLEVNHNINVLPQQYYNQGAAEVTYLNATVPNPMAGKFSGTTTLNNASIANNLLLLPFPQFGSVTAQYSSIGSAPYNALQIQVSKPMKNHFSLQANLTWQKTMLRNLFVDNYAAASGHLSSVQDPNATISSNIFGIVQLPRFDASPAWQRLLIGGWQFNGIFRAQNGNLISTPGNVDIIGNPAQSNPTNGRFINTCYENTSGQLVASTSSAPACDNLSPNPAYRQRLQYTSQNNSNYINVRQRIHPLMDAALFKQFILREHTSFEIRGEFFNVLNTPNFGGPNTTLGNSSFGAVTLTQANDSRIGQLTARINF
jgi:Carboxypeptidase regulatory-like domain